MKTCDSSRITGLRYSQGTDADDASWPWRSKLDDLYVSEGAAEHVVVVIDDRVQGTLVTTLPDATSGL